jgi:hypothetical protein
VKLSSSHQKPAAQTHLAGFNIKQKTATGETNNYGMFGMGTGLFE